MRTTHGWWSPGVAIAATMLAACGPGSSSGPDATLPDAPLVDATTSDAQVCPSPEPLWDDIDLTTFTSLPELESLNLAADVTPAQPATYWEIRRGFSGSDQFTVLASAGNKCADAADVDACRAAFDALTSDSGFHYSCLPGQCYSYVAVNRGDTSELLVTAEELAAFLGDIDSITEAALIAYAHGYNWDAGQPSVGSARAVPDGYELLVTELTAFCAPIITDRVYLRVAAAGTAEVLRRQPYSVLCDACI